MMQDLEPISVYTRENCPAGTTIYLNGADVSARCTAADPWSGWVDLIAINERGHAQADGQGGVVTERRWGAVTIRIPHEGHREAA